MPSALHETLLELFRQRPQMAAELIGGVLGVGIPDYAQARLDPADCTDLLPTEFRADAVVVLGDTGRQVLAVVVEIQLRPDPAKRWSWPAYVCTLRSRLRCPTELLVVCPDPTTAAWCADAIGLGVSGSHLTPLVLGPDRVPLVTGPDPDRPVEWSVLSALAHGSDPDRLEVLDGLVAALSTVEKEQAKLYLRLVLAALPHVARRHLEGLMRIGTKDFEFESELFDELRDEGRAQGLATAKVEAIVAVIDARGLAMTDDARSRITGCTDLDQLDAWVRRAVTVASVEELFA